MALAKLIQTPREIRRSILSYDKFLAVGETIDDVSVTVTPPAGVIAPDYVAPQFDQRVVMLDVSDWVFNGANTVFPLKAIEGPSVQPLAAHYLTIVVNGVVKTPYVDFTVSGTQITFLSAPANLPKWGVLNSPIMPTLEQRDYLTDPPYGAFAVQGYIISPDDRKILLVSQGGAAPSEYAVKVNATTSLGQQREVAVAYQVREP